MERKRALYWGTDVRNIPPDLLVRKGALKVCSKFKEAQPCQSVMRHGHSPVNLLHILRTPFSKNTS